VVNYTDYKDLKWNNTTDTTAGPIAVKVPLSCCLLKNPGVFPTLKSDFVDLGQCLNNANTASLFVNARVSLNMFEHV